MSKPSETKMQEPVEKAWRNAEWHQNTIETAKHANMCVVKVAQKFQKFNKSMSAAESISLSNRYYYLVSITYYLFLFLIISYFCYLWFIIYI